MFRFTQKQQHGDVCVCMGGSNGRHLRGHVGGTGGCECFYVYSSEDVYSVEELCCQ